MARLLRGFPAVLCVALSVGAGAAPMRVATTDNYPPYSFRNPNGELQGYVVDTWRLWEKKTGTPVVLTGTEWAQAQQLVLGGKADVVDMIIRTPAREPLYDFTPPYSEISTAIYADASISGLHNPDDLKGFLVGVVAGDACVEYLQKAGVSTLRPFANHAAMMDAAAKGSVKIFCLDEYPANYYLYRLGLQRKYVSAFNLLQGQFRRAVRKGDAETLATVNRGMALITAKEDAALREKWMGKPVIPEYIARLGQIVLVLALLTIVLLIWLRSVRKAVHTRTVELEQEKARLRALIENSPDLIWLKDPAGHYLSLNLPGTRLMGRAERDIIGKTDLDLFPAADAESFRRVDLEALRTRAPIRSEHQVLFPETGQNRLFETIRTAVETDGNVLGILGFARDITLRRLQEQTIREQEALLNEMSSLARIGAWEFHLATGRVVWTEELARLHETSVTDQHSIADCLSYYQGENRVKAEWALKRSITSGKPCDLELEMVTAKGNPRWIRATCHPFIENGKVVKVCGTLQDITERRKLQESMRMANLIYQTSHEAIAVTDAQNNVVDANPAYLRQTGRDATDVIGAQPTIFNPDMHDAEFYERLWQDLALHDQWEGEIWDRTGDGAQVARLVNIRVVRAADGKVFRRVIQFFDITEQKLKDELIWKQTNFDALTGLPNRRLFEYRLAHEIKKAHGSGATLGLMFIDLDHFKHVNDTWGRSKGDRVLVEVTRRLSERLPETATLARLEADSFAIVISPVEAQLHLDMLAEALIQAVSAPIAVDSELAYLGASIGIALYPSDGGQAEELLRHAEQAMSMAKQDRHGHISYFTRSTQREARAKLMLTNDLRQAIARRELQLFYQPIVEVASGRIRKAEALLRWAHPVHGMISPALFIPLAEESGLIVEIGEWVFQEAIASIERWQRKFGNVIELSVNNSPVQFEQAGACQWIDRLARSGLPPASLTVEITEGVLMTNSEHVMLCLQRLHETGTKLSIDDFGTGFSSLSYLKHLDVDYLKIDKSFVANLAEDYSDQALTGAIIDMGHKLGIRTIAEGVETVAQRNLLSRFGCDYVQGHLYSQPVPRDIFELLVEPQEAH